MQKKIEHHCYGMAGPVRWSEMISAKPEGTNPEEKDHSTSLKKK
jgi:hypothetical protein